MYNTLKLSTNTGDWAALVEHDKKQLGINMSNEEIQGVSKEVFKRYVTKKVKANFPIYLNEMKNKHSKSSNLKCEYLVQGSVKKKKSCCLS